MDSTIVQSLVGLSTTLQSCRVNHQPTKDFNNVFSALFICLLKGGVAPGIMMMYRVKIAEVIVDPGIDCASRTLITQGE